jgi:hypothetical protein
MKAVDIVPARHIIYCNNSGRRDSGEKRYVKFACKQLFAPEFTSEESPTFLVLLCRTRRWRVLNRYEFLTKK